MTPEQFKTSEVTRIIGCHERFIPSVTSPFRKRKAIFVPKNKGQRGQASTYSRKEVIVLAILHECRVLGLPREWVESFGLALDFYSNWKERDQRVAEVIEFGKTLHSDYFASLLVSKDIEKDFYESLDPLSTNFAELGYRLKSKPPEYLSKKNQTSSPFRIPDLRKEIIFKINFSRKSEFPCFEILYKLYNAELYFQGFTLKKGKLIKQSDQEKIDYLKEASTSFSIDVSKIIEEVSKNIKLLS